MKGDLEHVVVLYPIYIIASPTQESNRICWLPKEIGKASRVERTPG